MTEAHGLQGVELRHLAALEAIAAAGSLTGAAARLGYTQSAVSGQLASLERLVGQPLVSRVSGARAVSLTPAGLRLLGHARDIRARVAAAGADMAAFAAGLRGVVRFGVVPSLAGAVVPAAARALARQAPGAELAVEESHRPRELLDALRDGRSDLVLAPLNGDVDPGVAWDDLGEDPYVLLVAAHDRLARLGRPVEPADVADRQVVGKDCGSPSQQAIERALERHGIRVSTLLRAHDGRTVREAVVAGVGVAFLPRLLVEPGDGARALPVAGWLRRAASRCSALRPGSRRPPPASSPTPSAARAGRPSPAQPRSRQLLKQAL